MNDPSPHYPARAAASLCVALLAGCASSPDAPLPPTGASVRIAEDDPRAVRARLQELPSIETPRLDRAELPLDLGTALRLAAASNLDIQAARARVAIATAKSAEAAAAWLPRLGLSASSATVDGTLQGVFGDIQDVDFDTARAAIDVGWRLNPGQAAFDQLAARSVAAASAHGAEAAAQSALLAAFVGYHDLLDARQEVALGEANAARAARRAALMEVRSRTGLGALDAWHREQSAAVRAEAAHDAARRRYQSASTRLAATLTLDPSTTLVPTETVLSTGLLVDPSLRLADLLGVAELRSPTLARADLLVEAAGYRRRAAQWAAWGPSLSLVFPWHWVGTGFGSLRQSLGYFAGAGFGFGFDSLARIDTAHARQELAALTAAGLRLDAHSQLVDAYIAWRAADERLLHARRSLALAEELARTARARAASGFGDEIAALEAEQRLDEASLEQGLAATSVWRAQAHLLAAVGEVTPASLGADAPRAPAGE